MANLNCRAAPASDIHVVDLSVRAVVDANADVVVHVFLIAKCWAVNPESSDDVSCGTSILSTPDLQQRCGPGNPRLRVITEGQHRAKRPRRPGGCGFLRPRGLNRERQFKLRSGISQYISRDCSRGRWTGGFKPPLTPIFYGSLARGRSPH